MAAAKLELDAILERLTGIPEAEQLRLAKEAGRAAANSGFKYWQPNPGAQTEAYFCTADELAFGGEAGPGKSALIIGKSLNYHKRSLILRRTNTEGLALADEYEKTLGFKPRLDKHNAFRVDNKKIRIGGCQNEDDKQKYKGQPYDLIAVDQVEDFTESIYTFIIQWNRTTEENIKPQIIVSLNPPTQPAGLWVMRRWGPWLDPHHPRPAKSGEIRYYTNVKGEDTEVDGPGPHDINGRQVMARSRTFIRGKLSENLALARTGYDSTRAAAPEQYRAAYHDGNFEASLADVPNQVCPTAWVRAAVQRWHKNPPDKIPQCAIGVDASGGGNDPMVLAIRYDGWYAPMVVIPGKDIPAERAGKHAAGIVMSYRRDDGEVMVDMGGGYGGPLYEQLNENGISVQAYKGAEGSVRRTKDGLLSFANKRAEVYWRFREALDPSDPAGSPIMLPDDPLLFADLTAPVFLEDRKVITLEPKEKVVERLGRSPDRGDAVVIAWACGPRYVIGGIALERTMRYTYRGDNRPQVVMGRGRYSRRK